jgi:hypothetical protein
MTGVPVTTSRQSFIRVKEGLGVMKAWGVLAATLATVGCGLGDEPPCVVDANVVGAAVPDSVVDASSARATLRVGQTIDICMLGTGNCTLVDHRFEFQTDSPSVVTLTMNPSTVSAACNELHETNVYPCCTVRTGRLTAVGAGTAHVRAVLLRGSAVEKTGELIWCPRFGAGSSRTACRPIAVEVTP